jgi:PAS domain S-box-containing protein
MEALDRRARSAATIIAQTWGNEVPRLSARLRLLGLIAAVLVPVWLFAAYLLAQYAMNERQRFEREAQQVAHQVSLVVEGELTNLLTVLRGLSKSEELARGDLKALRAEAVRLVIGSDRVILLRELDGKELLNTAVPLDAALPPALPLAATEREKAEANAVIVTDVHQTQLSKEYRVAVALPVHGPHGERWLLAITVPTTRIRDIMMPAVPTDWIAAVGDSDGTYVARSELHDETTGQPGLPEYVAKVVGTSGTFTARNFQGTTLLAGYYRSDFSNWFYTANIPLSVVRAPLWRSLIAIGAAGLLAMAVSVALAYFVGKGFAKAARGLAARAEALGKGERVAPMPTSIAEFAIIADTLVEAERAIAERTSELETVLETVPAAVWFTYDPGARQVIRNRFAATLMGLPTNERRSFGAPDLVIDTIALKDGRTVSREDRPLSRAMRGQQTDDEESEYILLDGTRRVLLTSARPIHDPSGRIIGAVQISLDITERKRGEEQRKLLVHELNHRVKNTLAVVQAVASQTLRSAGSLTEAESSLVSRLVSLAKAHDILTQENWSGADLDDVILASIRPHSPLERLRLDGPQVRLPPSLALSIAMATHELTTNAIKYGALSRERGTVSIGWTSTPGEQGEHLRIEWREQDGPPVVPPERQGFGTRMLARIFDSERGRVALRFEPTGLVCVIEMDLARQDAQPTAPARPTVSG